MRFIPRPKGIIEKVEKTVLASEALHQMVQGEAKQSRLYKNQ